MRELERIKKERAAEAARQERETAETDAREADSAILQGNPLLDPTRLGASAGGASFSVKRRCAAKIATLGGARAQWWRAPCGTARGGARAWPLRCFWPRHEVELLGPPTPCFPAGGTTTSFSRTKRASPRRKPAASSTTRSETTSTASSFSATSSERALGLVDGNRIAAFKNCRLSHGLYPAVCVGVVSHAPSLLACGACRGLGGACSCLCLSPSVAYPPCTASAP